MPSSSDFNPRPRRGLYGMLTSLLAGALCVLASSIQASQVPLTIEQLVAVSDNIVTVRVTDVKSETFDTKIITRTKVQVLESFKGKMKGEQEIVTLGGKYKTLIMDTPMSVKLLNGEEAILFLSRPYDRMPKAQQQKYNLSSPLVSTFQPVGGRQGKLTLITENGDLNKSRKGNEPVPEDLKVTRFFSYQPVRTGDKNAVPLNPGYTEVRSAIQQLVAAEQNKRSTKGALDTIAGIQGKFAIPEALMIPAVRAFDPLPALAYATDEELDKLNKDVQKHSAEKAAPSGEESSSPSTGK